MGVLRHVGSGTEHPLLARHVVGRGPASQLRLDDPNVSSVHAELVWDELCWSIRDLSSRNGTFVGGVKLEPGQRIPLEPGVEIAFADERCRFRLVDVAGPQLHAIACSGPASGQVRVAVDGLLALPDDEQPQLCLFLDHEQRWTIESDQDTRLAVDRELLSAGGEWRLFIPTRVPETRVSHGPPSRAEVEFRFTVSRDEEHIELSLVGAATSLRLEPRAHLELLLQLGRSRLRDIEAGLPEPEQGWLHRDDLAKMLAIGPELLSLWVHRARKQLSAAGLRDAGGVIERRAAATQLRLGVTALQVHRS